VGRATTTPKPRERRDTEESPPSGHWASFNRGGITWAEFWAQQTEAWRKQYGWLNSMMQTMPAKPVEEEEF
jgi:hypothetical protein